MTEVDAVIPESVASLQSQTNSAENNKMSAASNSKLTTASSVALTSKDQLKSDKIKTVTEKPEALDVDAPDTEEDDSQITSSTENGVVAGDNSKTSETTGKRRPSQSTSSENSKDASLTDADAITMKDKLENASKSNATSSNEDSSNACDAISRNCDDSPFNKADQNSDSELPAAVDTEEGENSTASGTNNGKSSLSNVDREKENTDGEAEGDAVSQDASSDVRTNSRQQDFNEDMISIEAKDEKSTDVPVDDCSVSQECAEDPLNSSEMDKEIPKESSIQKENGAASELEKAKDDTGIVDLDDDSDEEMEDVTPKESSRNLKQTSNGNSNGDSALNYSAKKAKSVCSDSDGAVVIGSDSENEAEQPPISKQPQKPDSGKVDLPQEIADDDDDDCVVIEDDTPAPAPSGDVSKRKNLTVDLATNSDDSQPPNKRQRTSLPPSAVSQITIKDARSLMPQEAPIVVKDISNDTATIYPVNIRPSSTTAIPATTPPKLVPVSNSIMQPVSTGTGLSTNTNLLPGLTDDMYVLEAPSFIVPYIYEKPPTDNLRDIVRNIETKYELTKEDLADADKSDEFDMMTEQNKEDKDEKSGKKKKRRRGGDDGDESWSEESDEDDDEEDDEDSEGGVRTKVLIKEAQDDLAALKVAIKPAAAVVTNATAGDVTTSNANIPNKPGQENYFESPLGKFFMDIGVGLVQEFVQSDLIRLQKRKMRKSLGKNITEFERAIAALSGNLDASKKKNSPFRFTMKRCEFCNFKSESALSMANHYETPHMNGQMFKCNFCTFEIRNDKEIVYHMEAVHNIKARLIKPLPYHQCPNCSFEDNGKAKLGRHQPVCAKKFRPELNLAPPHDWEAPAKIPRIKPRHGLVGTATAYQAMAAQAAAQKAALASIQQQQQQAAQARSIQAAALAAQNAANKIRGRPPTITKPGPNPGSPQMRGPNQVRNPMANNVVMSPNNYQLPGAQLINANAMAKKTLSGQPSISITPLPRQSGSAQVPSPSSSKMPPAGMKPGQSPSGNKAQFVICEICDGYIKDLEQLRNHMQWMHKVKIHPKMIYNRPPLNCQKCQFRFFTDQGLERHLLGSHGLVTSSMQEAANKGKDAGRCPVCGRLYQWKLLNHVSRDHHMTLKPAHLSYKCTVCTATFGMYKQFETHVYTAHSTVAKKAMDGKKNNNATTSSTMAGSSQRNSLGATNDSLLKPLKINDEITIIPQPASKPRITNMESHVID